MSREIVALEPHESVVAALDLMIEARRRSLPVVERHPTGPILLPALGVVPMLAIGRYTASIDMGIHANDRTRHRGGEAALKLVSPQVVVPAQLIPHGAFPQRHTQKIRRPAHEVR
jgi:hypothetical protein